MEPITEEKSLYRYDEGKWSIRDIAQHLIDAEWVFSYRMMRFARGDKTDLPGFDQNEYVEVAHADDRSLTSLLDELKALRTASINLCQSFTQEMMERAGTANGYPFSVKMIAYIISGHTRRHIQVIRERYLT